MAHIPHLLLGSLSLSLSLLLGSLSQAEANIDKAPQADAWLQEDLVVEISAATRASRATTIRDSAAGVGMTNGVLLAGIGEVETNFAHCWSEATWACQGPASSSCGGGPVIAGSADGACSLQQGGLGLFQFDAGTYSQTISTYGSDIVTMSGNTNAVVPFLVTRAIESVSGVNTSQQALDWMNSIKVIDGDPDFEAWLYFIAWRYNGCKGCTAQQNKYRAGTHKLLTEMGSDFWASSQLPEPPVDCADIPAAGSIIEEDDDCHEARGPEQFWRHENAGHGGTLNWTKATANSTPSNYGIWNLRFEEAGSYSLEVFSDGGAFGQSAQAGYEVLSKLGSAKVSIDQSSASGWISLGNFEFDAGEAYNVQLNDNTGEPWAADPGGLRIVFDALRVSPAGSSDTSSDDRSDEGSGAGGPEEPGDEMGGLVSGCSTSGRSSPLGAALWLLVSLVALRRRKSTLAR